MARAEMTFTVKDIPEVKTLVAQLTERAEKAEAAIQRVRAVPRFHAFDAHDVPAGDAVLVDDLMRALDAPDNAEEATDA